MNPVRDKVVVLSMLSLSVALIVFILLVFNQGIQGMSNEDNLADTDPIDVVDATIDATAVEASSYVIVNPYANVDWENFGQFKTSLHNHSLNSDGVATTAEMVERLYALGYDIAAITDHNYLSSRWSEVSIGAMSTEREEEILAGEDRNGRPLFPVPFSGEQSGGEHLNSFFVKFDNSVEMSTEDALSLVEEMDGISFLNHLGYYTGGSEGGQTGLDASNDREVIQKYTYLFMNYPSCIGMEIFNKRDTKSQSDRVLWDNILMQTMPQGRPVWGFANDDAHKLGRIGFSFNVLLIDRDEFLRSGLDGLDARNAEELREQSASNPIRTAMTDGAFYAVSRIDRRENINDAASLSENELGDLLLQSTPSIRNISVDETAATITISGADYDIIEWIADGIVISTGEVLDVPANTMRINSYVRAQLRSSSGIAFTQPFGIAHVNSR